jgi:enoyl-CoA hydratase
MAYVDVSEQEHVATITVNRPDKLNALSSQVIAELYAAFAGLIHRGAPMQEDGLHSGHLPVRAAVLTGAGKAFVAGADIAAMAEMTPAQAKHFSEAGHALCAQIERAPFPVIAAVNGFALGGGLELALACDFIYAAETAKLGQPEVGLAVIPGFGGTQRLTRRIGIGRARELVYTGKTITADDAARIGLVNEVVPAAELMARAYECAKKIAAAGPLAVAQAKRVMLHGEGASLTDACELEIQAFAGLFGSADQRAGMQAFLTKAKAEFRGA